MQRINTHGGKLEGACDKPSVTFSVPYSADYVSCARAEHQALHAARRNGTRIFANPKEPQLDEITQSQKAGSKTLKVVTLTAKEVIEMSRSHGVLAKQLYVVFTKPVNGLEPILANMKDHLDFQIGLEKDGIMFAAGPNWTDDEHSWEGDGMVVIRAGSIEEARKIAARDPMHQRGARSFTVRPWLVNEGSVSVRIDYSTGKFSIS